MLLCSVHTNGSVSPQDVFLHRTPTPLTPIHPKGGPVPCNGTYIV